MSTAASYPVLMTRQREAASARVWPALLMVALVGLGLTLATHRYYGTFIRGADAQMYYAQARSLIIDGDLRFNNEVTELSPHREVFYDDADELRVPRTADGRIVNKYTFGWALLALPAFIAAHGLTLLAGGEASGYSGSYDVGVALWVLACVFASLVLLTRLARRVTDGFSASVAVVAVFIATNLAYYTSVYPMAAHAAAFVAVATLLAAAWAVHVNPASRRAWWSAAAAAALVVLIRPTDGVFLLCLAPAMVRLWRSDRSSAIRRTLTVAAGVAIGAGMQLLIWRISLGYWTTNPYADQGEGFHWLGPALPDILVSTNHGAWYYHPVFMLGLIGVVWMALSRATRHRACWIATLFAYLAHVYIHAAWHDWSFSHSFGHRMFVNSAPVMMLGVAALIHRLKTWPRRVAVGSIAVFAAWNLLLMVSFVQGRIPPVGDVTPARLLQAQVETITSAVADR